MESLAQSIGKIAVVGLECVCKCVALGFEHKTYPTIVVQYLINGGGRTVCRDKQGLNERLFGRLIILFVGIVFGFLLLVLFQFGGIKLLEFVVNRLNDVLAQGKPTLASRCLSGDKNKQVWKNFAFPIYAMDTRQTGGNHREGTEQQKVGIFVGICQTDNLSEKRWKRIADKV